jgi:hypothetical protein
MGMTTRKGTKLLWRTAIVAGAGAVLTIVLAVALPLDAPVVDAADSPIGPTTLPVANDGGVASLAEFSKVWSVDLGHNSAAPSEAAADAQQAQTPPPVIHVVGTIIEPGHSLAMILGDDGKTVFKNVGDVSEGAKITAIAIDSVTFDVSDKAIVYKVEKAPAVVAPTTGAALPPIITPSEDQ